MKLHLACGKKYLDGYTNVDIDAPRLDIVCNLASPESRALAFDGMHGKVEEILCVHFLEHIVPWQVPAFLRDYHALLRDGGRLILELPDLLKCARNVLNGERDQLGMWGLYGDPSWENPHMLHHWAYTSASLTCYLVAAGFDGKRITQEVPHWHPSGRYNRDMRIEATR
jgi:predicted SAM-dependent methyltransferase